MNLLREPYEMMFHTVAAGKRSILMTGMTGANVPSVKPNSDDFVSGREKSLGKSFKW